MNFKRRVWPQQGTTSRARNKLVGRFSLIRRASVPCRPSRSQWCGAEAEVAVAELIATFGQDRNVRTIGRHVLGCKDKRAHREGENCPVTYQA
jgi:hypothetical protein